MTPIEQKIAFILELEKLKNVLRKTRPVGLDRRENSAEHSWQSALTALVFLEGTELNAEKVLKMMLIHDVVEIDAGDVFVYDSKGREDVVAVEQGAAMRVFGLLPEPLAGELLSLWQEFETAESPEARFAKAIDRINPVLQNLNQRPSTWEEFDISESRVLAMNETIAEASTELWNVLMPQIKKAALRPE